ncbi:hypothetical protein R1sor_008036 [Riccia sorocarpa]|uniref:Nodulin-like domain-containing protein n=1 Tax=Riccia sorocarpa TaxID=122646 RepID=A0ABD3HWA1_9MARC
MLKSRWFVVACAMWMQSFNGSPYVFGVYSQKIKLALNYDQKEVGILATFKDIGSHFGILPGIILEHVSPSAVLVIGAMQSGFGYLMMWLSVTGKVRSPSLWQMCLYIFTGANGLTFFDTVAMVTCVRNFPHNRGIVIGLVKGFLGLSGAILTQLYRAIYADSPESFLFLLSWLPTIMALVGMFVLRSVPSSNRSDESTNLYLMSTIGLLLACYIMTLIIVETIVDLTHLASLTIIICGICGLILLPLLVVYKSERDDEKIEGIGLFSPPSPSLKEPLLAPPSPSSSSTLPVSAAVKGSNPGLEAVKKGYISEGEVSDEGKQVHRSKPRRGENHTFVEAVKKADFWLLFVAMACGMGSCLTAVDSMGQIGASQGYSVTKVGTFISLLSIWNFLGKLGFGMISEICLHRYRVPRPVFLALSQATTSIGHLVIAVAFPGSLYVGSLVIGLCYGAQWSLMPAITSEIFGLMSFGTLFNAISMGSPLGAYYLSVQVAGTIYDYEAEQEQNADSDRLGRIFMWLKNSGELLCDGAQCFRLTFMIMAAVSFFGCLVSLILVARTRRFYYQVVYARVETLRREKEDQERRGPSLA